MTKMEWDEAEKRNSKGMRIRIALVGREACLDHNQLALYIASEIAHRRKKK